MQCKTHIESTFGIVILTNVGILYLLDWLGLERPDPPLPDDYMIEALENFTARAMIKALQARYLVLIIMRHM